MKTTEPTRNDSSHSQWRASTGKKRYSRLELIEYGALATLTLSGSGPCPDWQNMGEEQGGNCQPEQP